MGLHYSYFARTGSGLLYLRRKARRYYFAFCGGITNSLARNGGQRNCEQIGWRKPFSSGKTGGSESAPNGDTKAVIYDLVAESRGDLALPAGEKFFGGEFPKARQAPFLFGTL